MTAGASPQNEGDAKAAASAAAPSKPVLAVALIVAILAVSSAATLLKLSEAPALVKAFYRLFYATLLLLPFALTRHRHDLRAIPLRDWAFLSGVGVVLALHFALWIKSLDLTSVAASLVFVTLHPLLVAGFAQAFMGERLAPSQWIGVLVAVGGGVAIGIANAHAEPGRLVGDLLAFGGAVAFAAYLLSARNFRQRMPLLPFVTVVYGAAAAALLLMAFVAGDSVLGWGSREHLLFLALAIVPMIFGHTVINWAVKYVPAAVVSVMILMEPVGGTILAFLVIQEVADPGVLLGGAVVLAGVYLVARRM